MPNPLPDFDCEHCQDTKLAHPDCETCEGNGWVDDPKDGGTMTCPECDGERCPHCTKR
jgi:hypothetical protein